MDNANEIFNCFIVVVVDMNSPFKL